MSAGSRGLAFSLLLVPSLLLTACGTVPGGSSTSGADTNKASANPLVGTWVDSCLDSGKSSHNRIVISDELIEVFNEKFDTNDCSGAAYEVRHSKTAYTLGSESSVVRGAREIDLIQQAATMTQVTSEAADRSNGLSTCGFTDWQAGLAKNLAGTGCEWTPAGTKIFSVIKLDGINLQAGTASSSADGKSEGNRLTSLSSTVFKKWAPGQTLHTPDDIVQGDPGTSVAPSPAD